MKCMKDNKMNEAIRKVSQMKCMKDNKMNEAMKESQLDEMYER